MEIAAHTANRGPHRQLLESSARVLGVGPGVFALCFFGALSLLVCLFGTRAKQPRLFYTLGAAIIAFVAVIVFGSPRGQHKRVKPAEGYDATLVPMVIIMVLMALGALLGLGGLLQFYLSAPLYARRLSYHVDVLQQW